MSAPIEYVERVQDHWWWRPGWRVGRHFYACHFVMSRYPALTKLVSQYQAALDGFPGLDAIPERWLHLTMQGIGFVDKISAATLMSIETNIRRRLIDVERPVVTFHRPVVRPEAVYLPASPTEQIAEVRAAVWRAASDVLGKDQEGLVPEYIDDYRPHVSIAYSNRIQPGENIAEALYSVDAEPVTVILDEVALLEFHRDAQMYQWARVQALPIGL
jgi:hypothetical protein